ncbi:MAG: methyltransferase domain-containing protein [Candidatus Eremiobacteraeota bacterium]|nr:methyltransferase domain-containing protein [Candidatus Eremiobacteraeota bacterium]MBV8244658.1 methyltransferase domain-containing protein [Candidatus Eremiobacteraeota bacterium]
MKPALMDYIWCPYCHGALTLAADAARDGEIETGNISCGDCGRTFPILRGIPRFIENIRSADDLRKVYADSFGHQWTTYNWLRDEDPYEFQTITDLTPQDLKGKSFLDAGCGGGRVARFVAPVAGAFFGMDFSIAVEKAAELCKDVPNAHFVQCDINYNPFKPEQFDIVHSHGVIHHTRDTKETFDKLPPLVKPGGILYVAVFRKTFEPLQWSDSVLRQTLNKLPISALDKVCDAMSYLNNIPRPAASVIKRFFWFSQQHTKEIRKCCLYDWYGPTYHHEHTVEEVINWFERAGFEHPKYINAWPYAPADEKYRVPTWKDSLRLGQLLGVIGTKVRRKSNFADTGTAAERTAIPSN